MSDGNQGGSGATQPSPLAAAFFDVDGTIVSTHIVHQYLFVRRHLAERNGRLLAGARHAVWQSAFYLRCLQYLYLDHVSRTRMNVAFYRNYAGLRSDHVRQAAVDCFDRLLKPHLYNEAIEQIVEHLRADRRVVLVTGSIDFLIEPLARFLTDHAGSPARVDLLARTLLERDGRFTGELDGPPVGEQVKAQEVRRYATDQGIDLSRSHAYGDSIADLPMLQLVGYPCVVNGDRLLSREARRHGWPLAEWRLAGSAT